ncbi:MAG: hypothetical protein J0M26_12625 [Planctomycetes bacterium]|nr:hypothetical protein [Planctomycetota bacterium]
MARNSWNVLTLLVALMLSGSYFTWGQYPSGQIGNTPTVEPPATDNPGLGFPAQAIPGNLTPQSPVSGAGVGPNFPQVAAAGNGELLMTTSLLSDGRQQVVITDTKARTMAIYEVEPTTGKVLLRSVREIKWDLQMQQFNATSPTPGEIRSMSGLK